MKRFWTNFAGASVAHTGLGIEHAGNGLGSIWFKRRLERRQLARVAVLGSRLERWRQARFAVRWPWLERRQLARVAVLGSRFQRRRQARFTVRWPRLQRWVERRQQARFVVLRPRLQRRQLARVVVLRPRLQRWVERRQLARFVVLRPRLQWWVERRQQACFVVLGPRLERRQHTSLFSGHGSSGGSSHGSLFSGHGSSGGSSHGSLFSGHGSSGGASVRLRRRIVHGIERRCPGPDVICLPTNYALSPVVQPSTGVAYLNVNVPEDAKVYLQDKLMTIGGTDRRFVTPQMQAGVEHLYTVKVEVVRNGQTVSKTAQATVAAGQEVAVAVAFDVQNQQDAVASTALVAGR